MDEKNAVYPDMPINREEIVEPIGPFEEAWWISRQASRDFSCRCCRQSRLGDNI